MAFKIKSAKIFFFGIKEHTVMLLSVVLSYLRRPGRYRTSTGRGKRGVAMPTSCESRQAPDKGHTGRDSCPSPGEGVAQGWRGGREGRRERQQSPATGGPTSPRWCDCSLDFLVNFGIETLSGACPNQE